MTASRRQFISLLGGAAAMWPLAARAQQLMLPMIGFLHTGSADAFAHAATAFRRGLADTDFMEGRSVRVEYRWGDGSLDRLPSLAADLLRRQPAVIVAVRHGAQALKTITTTTPVVFISADDPVELGLVESLNRPGGNMTGVYMFTAEVEAKRLGLLRDAVPKKIFGVLIHRDYSLANTQVRDVQQAAVRLGVQVVVVKVNPDDGLEAAFTTMIKQGAAALLICASPFLSNRRDDIVTLATRHKLPSLAEWREFAVGGGLMSYGNSLTDMYRQLGVYAGRILTGVKPADLPVVRPTRFELVLNLRTARTLGLSISDNLLTLADEIIE